MQDEIEIKDEKVENFYTIDEVVEILKNSWDGKRWEFDARKKGLKKDE